MMVPFPIAISIRTVLMILKLHYHFDPLPIMGFLSYRVLGSAWIGLCDREM
jgi:hypothetical protein